MDGSDPGRDPAAELLVSLLVRNPHPGEAELEALCLAHPSLAAELRRLCAVWRAALATPRDVDRLLAAAADLGSEVALLDDAGAPPTGTRDLIERLYRHRPEELRYQQGEVIDSGGMGEIRRVWDTDLRRPLAKKSMLKSKDDPDFPRYLRRFLDEAQITGQLQHPSIVPVHEFGVDRAGELYFTMPLIRGRRFDEIIEAVHAGAEGWTMTRALHVVIKICDALAFAHSHGVVHRDVKPPNVMVGRFGETYVMDWGLARVLGEADRRDLRFRAASIVATDALDERIADPGSPLLTMDGQAIGTPHYMSPEQASGRTEEIGARSDVYGVGTVLYQLLANRPPYHVPGERVAPLAVLARVRAGPPPSITSINPAAPRELVEICDGAMARRIRDRYVDASELARDLERYLDNRLPVASERSLARVTRLAIRRHRGIAITVGAAALLISALLVGFILRLQGEAERQSRMLDFMASAALQDVSGFSPIRPERIPAMDLWLERVAVLLGRAPRYESEQQRNAATPPPTGDERATMLQNFASLRVLAERIRGQRRIAEDMRLWLADPDVMLAWRDAERSVQADPRFPPGFVLRPHPDLVPLRADPVSRLREFWLPASGEQPQFDPQKPGYAIGPDTGIVLVLLPGGAFTLGSPATEPHRSDDEASVACSLRPYFLAKYETTQGQWLRVMGFNPSDPEAAAHDRGPVLAHPVEQVRWRDASEFARRLGLRLPSEPEWECACRAGTTSAFYWGDEGTAMHRPQDGQATLFENVADLTAFGPKDNKPAIRPHMPWSDDFSYHAPVGTFAPNPFGLHDMQGNVSEWCREDYYQARYDDESVRNPDLRVLRGGNWASTADLCRSAQRQRMSTDMTTLLIGVRVALDALP